MSKQESKRNRSKLLVSAKRSSFSYVGVMKHQWLDIEQEHDWRITKKCRTEIEMITATYAACGFSDDAAYSSASAVASAINNWQTATRKLRRQIWKDGSHSSSRTNANKPFREIIKDYTSEPRTEIEKRFFLADFDSFLRCSVDVAQSARDVIEKKSNNATRSSLLWFAWVSGVIQTLRYNRIPVFRQNTKIVHGGVLKLIEVLQAPLPAQLARRGKPSALRKALKAASKIKKNYPPSMPRRILEEWGAGDATSEIFGEKNFRFFNGFYPLFEELVQKNTRGGSRTKKQRHKSRSHLVGD